MFLPIVIPVMIVPPAPSNVPAFTVGEGDGTQTVCVVASGAPDTLKRDVSVTLLTQNGEAIGKGSL
jgi:hypothetical protein